MTQAKQILTYIKSNTQVAEEITMTKDETLSIFKELVNEMRILESGCSEDTRTESLWID
jgi:hypothetical protein